MLVAVGAVGTVEKRGLFFHRFHSPVFVWQFHSSSSGVISRQPAFIDDRKAIEGGAPVGH